MSTQHDQSIGGPGATDGIAGSRSGTEGATSGAGVDKGAPAGNQQQSQERKPAPALGGNSSDSRQATDSGVMQKEPRDNVEERKPGP